MKIWNKVMYYPKFGVVILAYAANKIFSRQRNGMESKTKNRKTRDQDEVSNIAMMLMLPTMKWLQEN